MRRAHITVVLGLVVITVVAVSGYAFPLQGKEGITPRRSTTDLAQLNIFDDPAIDRRVADLQRRIDGGKRSGQLTLQEANNLQSTLDRVKEKIAKYRADGFVTPSERNQVNEMLAVMEERIRSEKNDDEVIQKGGIGKRLAEVQRRIDNGVRSGRLTKDEANRLEAVLNRIKDKEAAFRADNVLTDEERFRLTQMIDALEERIRFERNDTDTVHREAFEKRLGELKRKIEVGMRVGQVTLDEACGLNGILLRIKERDRQFRSDGVLTREERIRLNQMLAFLEDRIYEERWDADVNHPVFR